MTLPASSCAHRDLRRDDLDDPAGLLLDDAVGERQTEGERRQVEEHRQREADDLGHAGPVGVALEDRCAHGGSARRASSTVVPAAAALALRVGVADGVGGAPSSGRPGPRRAR